MISIQRVVVALLWCKTRKTAEQVDNQLERKTRCSCLICATEKRFKFFELFFQSLANGSIKTKIKQRIWTYVNSSVVRQKGESQNMFQENKARQIFRKTNIFYHLICTCTCAYQVVKNVRFSENLTFFVFLKHLLWDSPFCLITDELKH